MVLPAPDGPTSATKFTLIDVKGNSFERHAQLTLHLDAVVAIRDAAPCEPS